eukprot:c21124_g1_i1 orf=472-2166(-)
MASTAPLRFCYAFWALLLFYSVAVSLSIVESSSSLYGNVDTPSISVFGGHASEDKNDVVYQDVVDGEEIRVTELGALRDHDLERVERRNHPDILLAPSMNLKEIRAVPNAEVSQGRSGDNKSGLKDLTERRGIERKLIIMPEKWNSPAELEGELNLENDSITGVMPKGYRGGSSKAKQQQPTSLSNSFPSYKHTLQEKVGNESDISERDSEAKKVGKVNGNTTDSGELGKKGNENNTDEVDKSGDPNVNQDNRTTSSAPPSGSTGKDIGDSQLDSSNANMSTNKPPDVASQQQNPISEDKPKEASTGKDETDPHQKPGEDVSKEEGNGNIADKQPQNVCDSNHSCGDGKNMFSCLRTSGEGTQELSLLIENKGDIALPMSVTTPEFLRADPSDFLLERGASKPVPIYLVNFKAAKHAGSSKLNIKAGNYDCTIEIPTDYIKNLAQRNFFQAFPYPSIITPMVFVYMLVFIFVGVAAVWLWCRYGRKKRHGDSVKYQELEIGLSNQEKLGKMEEETLDGWDEVWDDDWEDTEAARSSSRPVQNLSCNGLAARRTNKDGWENNWDD